MWKTVAKCTFLLFIIGTGYTAVQFFWLRPYYAEASIEIAREKEQIYPFLVEPRHLEKWVGALVESRPLHKKGLVPGAQREEVIEYKGRRYVIRSEILSAVPGKNLEIMLSSQGFQSTVSARLQAVKRQNTRLSIYQETWYSGRWGLLWAPLLSYYHSQKLVSDLQRLKNLIEKPRASAFPFRSS